jgi:murein DD-endopeptidase MepM/ murein hydrolase activator NlpD
MSVGRSVVPPTFDSRQRIPVLQVEKFNTSHVIVAGAVIVLLPVLAYLIGTADAPDTDTTATVIESEATTTPDTIAAPVVLAIEEPAAPEPRVERVEIESGDNLMDVLVRVGAERFDAHVAIQSLQGVYDPRRDLRVGDELQVTLGPVSEPGAGSGDGAFGDLDYVLSGLKLPVSYDREVLVDRNEDGGFVAREVLVPLDSETIRVAGSIDSSLFVNATQAGVPVSVLIEMIRIFSFDVDFQRDIWRDDKFEVLFDIQRNKDGKIVGNGDIHYAKLSLRGTDLPLYRFENSQGDIDYFNEKGEGVRKALMKTPIDGARLSSRFGNRKHPILGYTRLHAGVDFAAPRGTPIYAAGDGSVVRAGPFSSFGNYIKIRHNGTYSTAYAHLNGFARGIRQGKRVRQGQVIGYVGTTGRSTGPHLHYEIHRDGKPINPLGLKLPSGEKLKDARLAAFLTHRDAVDAKFAAMAPPSVVAKTANPDNTDSRTLTE